MNSSAAAAWRASSRASTRIKTLVSIARMALPDVLPHALLQLRQRLRLRLPTEHRIVDLLRAVRAHAPDDDPVAFGFPGQHRARTEAELSPHGCGNRNLGLGSQFAVGAHAVTLPG